MIQKTFTIGLLAGLAALAFGGTAAPVQAPPAAAAAIDVETLGPKVGDIVPDFTLPDQHGAARTLKSLMGPKGAMLVFFRSADW